MLTRRVSLYEFRDLSFHLPKMLHNFDKNCLSYNIIKIINNTTCKIVEKILDTLNQGSHYNIKTIQLQNYSLVCDITNYYVCQKNYNNHLQ